MLKQLALVVGLVASGVAFADPDLTPQDRQFIDTVATANLAEIKLAKLALQKSQNAEVRHYAQMIIEDHEKAGRELQSIARNESLAVPIALDAQQVREYDRLSSLSGKQFDKEFMQVMVKDHETTVDVFQKATGELSAPQLKAFAEKTLPTLKQHQQHAIADEKDLLKKKK